MCHKLSPQRIEVPLVDVSPFAGVARVCWRVVVIFRAFTLFAHEMHTFCFRVIL